MALAAVSPDEEFYNQLKQSISSSSSSPEKILGMCRDIFLPSLNRLDGVQTPDWVESEENYPDAQERDYNRILLYAIREGKKMLASGDYEFVRVFESLTWIGLQWYDCRLCQFQYARESFQDDPESLVQRGVKIIRAATGVSPRNEN